MDLSIIIPCYNEVDNVIKIKDELLPVVRELGQSRSVEIFFVDDGSTDGTIPAIQKTFETEDMNGIPIRYIDNQGNWGLGKALRNGFSAAKGEIIITTDSDGTYKFSSIPQLLACLEDGVDVVTASPYHPDGKVVGVPRYRLILSQGSSLIYRFLVDNRIHTYTCLFRAYRRKVVEDIDFFSNGFMAGTEILVKSILKDYRVEEYPAVLYRRSYGTSKAKLLRTILAHLRFQSAVLLHRLGLTVLVKSDQEKERRIWLRTRYSIENRAENEHRYTLYPR